MRALTLAVALLTTVVALFASDASGFHGTVCEHKVLRIRCRRPNEVVRVNYAIYGRRNRHTCPNGPIRTTNCASRHSLRIVRSKCNGKKSCAVWASNRVFGDPCVGTFKYLSVSYVCVPRPNRATACEHQTLSLRCRSPHRHITIISALYGRKNRLTCRRGPIRNTNCASSRSLSVMRSICNKRRSCAVPASNGIFGDPCVGTFKYLSVAYNCVPAYYRRTVCEHRIMSISCAPRSRVRIISALYGRRNRLTCRGGPIRNTRCGSSSRSLSVMRGRCNGKRSCVVRASNSVFGDPCVGTFKYLTILYQCV